MREAEDGGHNGEDTTKERNANLFPKSTNDGENQIIVRCSSF